MSSPEAVSGIDLRSKYLAWSVALGVLSAVTGGAGITWAATDAIERGIPDRLITALLIMSATLALAMLLVNFAFRRASPLEEFAQAQRDVRDGMRDILGEVANVKADAAREKAALSEALGALAAQVEGVAARVAAADSAFEYGRKYQQTVNGATPGLRAVSSEN